MTYVQSSLNSQYTFENFVVGPCNRFAHSAAIGITQRPAVLYNPLFLYSDVGLGKTHLMQAIGNRALSHQRGRLRAIYLTTEDFTNRLISAIQNRATEEFRQRFRNIDFLLIDDIHFIAGKDATQEEFFHTFNALHDRKKQIVISSDRPPKQIPTLEARLVSRFEWGLVASLEQPDFDTRVAILKKKSERCRMPIPTETLELIARNSVSNIRELEGGLARLIAASSLRGQPPSVRLAREILGDASKQQNGRKFTIKEIVRASAEFFNVKESDFESSRRSRAIAYPRQIAMHASRQMTSASFAEIGRAFGYRDHTTVMHAYRKIETLLKTDAECKALVAGLHKKIETRTKNLGS